MIGGVRLSRKPESSSSPEKQRDQIIGVAAASGAHIIGWAKDLEVSGATDPFTRPELGPRLRNMLGPYDGLAGAAVDRIGRDVYEGLNKVPDGAQLHAVSPQPAPINRRRDLRTTRVFPPVWPSGRLTQTTPLDRIPGDSKPVRGPTPQPPPYQSAALPAKTPVHLLGPPADPRTAGR